MGISAAILLLSLAAPPPAGPDETEIVSATHGPVMDHCDELACYYDPAFVQRVRALRCAPVERSGAPTMQCRFERSSDIAIPSVSGKPPPMERWERVEQSFVWLDGRWWAGGGARPAAR
jgi:hypothetical protein